MPTSSADTVVLNDGNVMPAFGLGVYQCRMGETKGAVLHALRAGYRHIDTAEIYMNEDDVGAAVAEFVAEGNVTRAELWITTKFFPKPGRGREAVLEALNQSLRMLRMEFVDLYLIHSPKTKDLRLEQWATLVEAQKAGLCRSIGVSNYGSARAPLFFARQIVFALRRATLAPHSLRCACSPPPRGAQGERHAGGARRQSGAQCSVS